MKSGINAVNASQLNRALVIKLICTNDNVSRVWLARSTGLSRMTLTNIVGEFERKGYIVTESGMKSDDRKGRAPLRLALSDTSPLIAGICLEEGRIELVMTDLKLDAKLRLFRDIPADAGDKETAEELADMLSEAGSAAGRETAGAGLVSNLPYDRVVYLAHALSEASGTPVFEGSRGMAGAAAEYYFGHGRRLSDFIYIDAAGEPSAGIVSGNTLVTGSRGMAGDLDVLTGTGDAVKGSAEKLIGAAEGAVRFMDPEAVIIGGIDGSQELPETAGGNAAVRLSSFGSEAPLFGAASLAAHNIFTGTIRL